MAASRAETLEYEVVHKRVAVRDAPSTTAQIVAVLVQGKHVRGTQIVVAGLPWLRLAQSTVLSNGESVCEDDSAWVLTDATSTTLGLGQLLRPLLPEGGCEETVLWDEEEEEEDMTGKVSVKVRCLDGTVHAVVVHDFANLQDLKVAIETATGIPRREQRLVHGAALLTDVAFEELLASGAVELALVRRDPTQARYLSQVKQDWQRLRSFPAVCRFDREIVLAAVSQSWRALDFAVTSRGGQWRAAEAAEELRSDREIVLAAARQDGRALDYASEALRADPEVVIAAMKRSCSALEWASPELLSNRDVVAAALEHRPELLFQASNDLRADRELVLGAVRRDGRLLAAADSTLQADHEVALVALNQCAGAMEFVAEQLRTDPALVRAANRQQLLEKVRREPEALAGVSSDLLEDRDVALAAAAAKRRHEVLRSAGLEFWRDEGVVLAAVEEDGRLLRYASEPLRSDLEVAIAAVRQSPEALTFVAPALQEEPKLRLLARLHHLEGNAAAEAFAEVPPELRSDRDIVLAAVPRAAEVLGLVPECFRNDREVVLASVNSHGLALRFAAQRLRGDCCVVSAAVRQDRKALEHAAAAFQADAAAIEAAATSREVDKILVRRWTLMTAKVDG